MNKPAMPPVELSLGIYRDGQRLAERQRDQLYAEAARALPELLALRSLYGRRMARAVAGGVTIIAFTALVFAWTVWLGMAGATQRLLLSVVLAAPAYALARLAARWHFGRVLEGSLARTHDPYADIERLRLAGPPLATARELTSDLELASLAYPMAAAALTAPLLLHLGVYLLFLRTHHAPVREFDSWIVLSGLIVGHAHCYLIVKASGFARDLQLMGPDAIGAEAARRGNLAWAGTLGVSTLPGIILLGIPPLLVAVTGGVVIPMLFRLAGRAALRERVVLGQEPSGPLILAVR